MKTAHFLKLDKTTSQNLASAALSYTTDYGRKFKLEQLIVNFSQAVTETITITLDSKHGANYDEVLFTADLLAEAGIVFRPQGEANYQDGDEIKVEITNANTTGIAYVTIKTSEL